MTKAAIRLEGQAQAITREALLDALSVEAERLDRALEPIDRTSRPNHARGACRHICSLGRILDEVGWGGAQSRGGIHIDPDRQLPTVLAALRRALLCAEDNAKDARELGDAEDAIRATQHLHDTWETLLSFEVQGMRQRSDGGQAR